MAVHKNDRGKWIAQVYDPETRRMRHVGSYDTKRDALDAEAKHRTLKLGPSVTVGEFAERWMIDYAATRPKASTRKHNQERVKRFAATYGSRRMSAIDRRTARAWALEHPGELSALRAMFTDALNDDLVPANPFAGLGLRQKRAKRDLAPDWLKESDITLLADLALEVSDEITGQIVRAAILTSAYTGVRPGELFALEAGDVLDGELMVSKAISSSTKEIGPPKNGKPRRIVLPSVAQDAITTMPRLHDRLLFTGPSGRQLYLSAWHNLWNPVRNAFKARTGHEGKLAYYELRHWAATHMIQLGLSPSDVGYQLGHVDGILVMNTYSHPSEQQARDRIRRALDNREAA